MRRTLLAMALVAAIALPASAAGPVTRTGAAYDGSRNPGGCEIFPENGSELHVKCTEGVGATGEAYIRFRFLADVDAVRGPATVSADLRDAEGCATYRWMAPVRTMRVEVPLGCYIHIRSVTWQQP
jgi:hypothetical protein